MPKITKQKDGSHYLLPAFCQWPLIYRVWCNLLYCPLLFFLEAVFPNRLLSKLRWLEVKFWTLFFFFSSSVFQNQAEICLQPLFFSLFSPPMTYVPATPTLLFPQHAVLFHSVCLCTCFFFSSRMPFLYPLFSKFLLLTWEPT